MSNLVFPALPLVQKERGSGRSYETTIHRSASGKELRSSWMSSPRYRFTLRIKCRSAVAAPGTWSAYNERSVIEYFLDTHRGSWDSFLYDDNGTQRRVRFDSDELEFRQIVPGVDEVEIDLVSVL